MAWLLNVVVVLQILAALTMVGLVLVQHGKGADMGASFGSGASGSLFGATGSANFLSRSTAVCAAVFFACTLGIAMLGNPRVPPAGASVLDQPATTAAPATGAAQIPGTAPAATGPSASSPALPAASVPASGAAAIPTQ